MPHTLDIKMGRENLEGKTAIVTGANTGLGKETARELAMRGARIILACRNYERAEAARQEITSSINNNNVVVKLLDLGSLESIKQFAEDINKTESRIDILVNNAGLFTKERQETKDGFEMMFGINHLGHFYLTCLLLDKIKSSAPSRIVILSSEAHKFAKFNFKDPQQKNGFSNFKGYGMSKTANILFGVHLSKILTGTGVTVYSVHPGVVTTEIQRDFDNSCMMCCFWCCIRFTCQKVMTPPQGAMTSVYCSEDSDIARHTGRYYIDCREKTAARHATNEDYAAQLWDLSLELCGVNS